jgi:hypothetical protein
MSYVVAWKKAAQDQLISLWIDSVPLRGAITEATHEIDYLLSSSPSEWGESREQDRRIMFVYPLAVCFRVLEQKQKVVVLSVRLTPRRR